MRDIISCKVKFEDGLQLRQGRWAGGDLGNSDSRVGAVGGDAVEDGGSWRRWGCHLVWPTVGEGVVAVVWPTAGEGWGQGDWRGVVRDKEEEEEEEERDREWVFVFYFYLFIESVFEMVKDHACPC